MNRSNSLKNTSLRSVVKHKSIGELLTEILTQTKNINPLQLAIKLNNISTNSHIYWNQWKNLTVDIIQLNAAIELVKRFEANGLQLKGKGLWFLSMLLKESILTFDIPKETIRLIVEILFHIGVEYEVSFLCVDILHHFIDNSMISAEELFNIAVLICEQFPSSVSLTNWNPFMQFAKYCVLNYSNCKLSAIKLLHELARRIQRIYEGRYFLNDILPVIRDFIQLCVE
eukprot:gene17191-23687_t